MYLVLGEKMIGRCLIMCIGDKVVERILSAREDREKIVVVGDSDTDGITGTAILYDFLKRELECNVDYYILKRSKNEYAIRNEAINNILIKNPGLIITVDFSAISQEALEKMKYYTNIIITDHHVYKKNADVFAVVNPKEKNPDSKLTGAEVALKLIQKLCAKEKKRPKCWFEYTDRAFIGALGDLYYMDIDNYIHVLGFKYMKEMACLGIKKLAEKVGIDVRGIVHLLNAEGKIGDKPEKCVKLLTKDCNANEAEKIVHELYECLEKYTKIRDKTYEILKDKNQQELKEKFVVLTGMGLHRGVLGDVAASFLYEYKKEAVVLLNIENNIAKGTVRSRSKDFRLLSNLKKHKLFKDIGGHEEAFRIKLEGKNLEELGEKIDKLKAIMRSICLDKSPINTSLGKRDRIESLEYEKQIKNKKLEQKNSMAKNTTMI